MDAAHGLIFFDQNSPIVSSGQLNSWTIYSAQAGGQVKLLIYRDIGAAVLGTKLIMVLGHNSCGAVNATVGALQKGNTLPGHIAGLVRAMKPGIESTLKQPGADLEQRAVVANVRYNVERLKASKPILAGMVAKNELRVVGGVYDLATGRPTRAPQLERGRAILA